MMAKKDKCRFRVAIIGMGKGGFSLARMFYDYPEVCVVGVSNPNQSVPGIKWAKENGIFTTPDYKSLLEREDIDIVVDATGDPEVEEQLKNLKRTDIEILKGMSASLMWKIIDEKEERKQESLRTLSEQKYLYDVGITLGSADNTDAALKLIVRAAMDLLDMSSGSAALFNEESTQMRTAMAIDTHEQIEIGYTWKLRTGGLTSHILSNKEPTVIEDVTLETRFDTDLLKSLSYKSLVAVPLRSEGKIIGILYVDDFNPRSFTDQEINMMGLLGTMAASHVDKLLMLERAEEMALTDELTKIYNHRHLISALSLELKRAERYKEDVSLSVIDVDHFKHYNDTRGHEKGNDILVRLAKLLKKNVRDTDIVARYGGEEFVVVFPRTEKRIAADLLERLRHSIEEYPFPDEEGQPNGTLTVSLGLAVYPEDECDADDPGCLINLADRAMYVSKTLGRNRVTVYGKEMRQIVKDR